MKHSHIYAEQIKVKKILSELFLFCIKIGANHIKTEYKDNPKSHEINLTANFLPERLHLLEELNECLSVPRQEEMEGYYWELTGNYSDESGFTIVGMMTDEVDISYEDDKMEINLVRFK